MIQFPFFFFHWKINSQISQTMWDEITRRPIIICLLKWSEVLPEEASAWFFLSIKVIVWISQTCLKTIMLSIRSSYNQWSRAQFLTCFTVALHTVCFTVFFWFSWGILRRIHALLFYVYSNMNDMSVCFFYLLCCCFFFLSDATLFQLKLLLLELLRKEHDGILVHTRLQAR